MPIASDLILDWAVKDGYSLSETGWIQARDRKFSFEVTAEKDGHRHIARAPDRETAVVSLGQLIGCPLDESTHFESADRAATMARRSSCRGVLVARNPA